VNRDPINAALDADPIFRKHWKGLRLRWRDEVPEDQRNAGIFRRRAIELTCEAIDEGETDPKAITDRVCKGFETIIISIVVKLLIEALVRAILKRRGLLKADRVGRRRDNR
jgi:hypothetical protein